jgi:hypothetical protein
MNGRCQMLYARALTVLRMPALGLSGFIMDAEESNAVESLISGARGEMTSRNPVKTIPSYEHRPAAQQNVPS